MSVQDVKVEGTPETGIRARVVRAHPSPVEALLGGALPDKSAAPAVTRAAPVVARTKYAVVRGAEEAAAAAAPVVEEVAPEAAPSKRRSRPANA